MGGVGGWGQVSLLRITTCEHDENDIFNYRLRLETTPAPRAKTPKSLAFTPPPSPLPPRLVATCRRWIAT